MQQKLIPYPAIILLINPKQEGIFLQIRYSEKEFSKSFKKDNFIFLSNHMSSVCHSNAIRMKCHLYVTRMPSCVIRMSLVCARMSSVCHSYILVCHPYVTRMYSYVIRMSLVCTRMSFVCHSYVLVCHSYVTRMYSYVIRMSLVCTHMSSACHTYVLVRHPCVTCMWFYHEPCMRLLCFNRAEMIK